MSQKLVPIALVVGGYDEAIRFYTEKLGFTLRFTYTSSPPSLLRNFMTVTWKLRVKQVTATRLLAIQEINLPLCVAGSVRP